MKTSTSPPYPAKKARGLLFQMVVLYVLQSPQNIIVAHKKHVKLDMS
jgi:hypothetical protein